MAAATPTVRPASAVARSALAALALLVPAAGAEALPIFLERFDHYTASGLAPGGGGGTLDSLRWRLRGLSDGDSAFGERRSGGHGGRGPAAGAVRAGGVYAFEVGEGNPALGFQPTAADLTPGGVELRLPLAMPPAASALAIGYRSYVLNDAGRATRLTLTWQRPDRPGAHGLAGATRISPAGATAAAAWSGRQHRVSIPAAALAGATEVRLRWWLEDAGGRGSRDQLALDDLRIDWRGTAAAVPGPGSAGLLAAALALLLSRSRRAPGRPRASSRRSATASR